MLAIEAQGLCKSYPGPLGRGRRDALRGLELAVEAGTAFGLIGPNGAGKTTFVKAILGIVRPTAGTARLLGGDPNDPKVRRRVGYLPERLHLPPALDAREVLRSVARLKRLSPKAAEDERLLEAVGLAGDAGRRVGTYSKGMRQRLGLACALLGSPDVLVLDEPTDGLDPLARVEVRSLLAREVARGATLFLNSHLLAETERVCTRIGILVEGRVVREGDLASLRQAANRWEVRFADGFPADRLAGAGLQAGGEAGRFTFDGEPADLNRALDRARAAGALLVGLSRAARDLEQVLADAIGGSP